METLILYRGDAVKIEEFRFHKTKSHCLLGKGIYLTNRATVAETYRSKGAYEFHKNYDPSDYQDIILLDCKVCKNKLEALERACRVFAIRLYEKRFNKRYHVRVENKKTKNTEFVASKDFLVFHEKIGKPEFQRLLELEEIVVEAVNKFEGRQFTIKVINRKKKELGKLTEFHFPKQFLERNIVKVHELGLDECKLLWEHGIHDKAGEYNSASEFIQKELKDKSYWRSHKKIFDIGDSFHKYNWNKFRNILIPYGMIGYEYLGGFAIGGFGHHRAFSIWDEDFVNKHRVV